uniref:Neur_chan_LBD domain-containing protein n=1 Tax=Steinernema glaseri TaxID=37863 RepID=A0A1I7ZRE4_9BILA
MDCDHIRFPRLSYSIRTYALWKLLYTASWASEIGYPNIPVESDKNLAFICNIWILLAT